MEYRGFSSDWCCYSVEIPWTTQEGLPRCNAVRSDQLLLSHHFLQIKVFWFTRVFSGKFSSIKTYSCICDLNNDVNHNVYLNKFSLIYFSRFFAENILPINLNFIFRDGVSGIIEYYQWLIFPFLYSQVQN